MILVWLGSMQRIMAVVRSGDAVARPCDCGGLLRHPVRCGGAFCFIPGTVARRVVTGLNARMNTWRRLADIVICVHNVTRRTCEPLKIGKLPSEAVRIVRIRIDLDRNEHEVAPHILAGILKENVPATILAAVIECPVMVGKLSH